MPQMLARFVDNVLPLSCYTFRRADKVANLPLLDTGMTAGNPVKGSFNFDVALYKFG